ncbi:MAG: alpha/beta fold hydrolase [Chloroflexota bacterium]
MFEYFPDNYQWSAAAIHAVTGGGNISEVDYACRSLKEVSKRGEDPAALEAWYESWKTVAERVEQLAICDEQAGNYLSAGRKYLRACLYYTAAEGQMSHRDPRRIPTYLQLLKSFKKGIQLSREPVEWVEVPYQGASLPALFIPAAGRRRAPCMIHFNGLGGTKEAIYFRVTNDFRDRGIALLIVDHPGVGEALRLRNMYLTPDTETPATACVDYLEGRPEVDAGRIGIIALSAGGYYAPRAAAFEKRLKCCVTLGAIWDYGQVWEQRLKGRAHGAQLGSVPVSHFGWFFGKDTFEEALEVCKQLTLEGVAEKITCPLLVIHGENDRQVPLWHAEKTIEAAVNSPGRKLKVFTFAEGGVEHCQVDNPTMGFDYAADWVAATLHGNPKGARPRQPSRR